jgi:type IV secretion system protein VirB8
MDEGTSGYFIEAAGWDADREATATTAARRAWVVAGAAVIVAALCVTAVVLLTPLKTVEPFVVRVDTSTGVVDVVPRYVGTADLPESVTRHLVGLYVTQRERYVPALAESDYEQTGAFHTAAMNTAWASAWMRSNPQSPLNSYADGTRVQVQLQSISFLKRTPGMPELVQVRFQSAMQHGGSGSEEVKHYIATLQVAYGTPPTDLRLRTVNPLGFKVLEYRREPEVIEETRTPAEAAAGAAP